MLLKNDHIRHVSGYQMLNVGYAVAETTTVTCSNGDRIRPIGVGVGNVFLRRFKMKRFEEFVSPNTNMM